MSRGGVAGYRHRAGSDRRLVLAAYGDVGAADACIAVRAGAATVATGSFRVAVVHQAEFPPSPRSPASTRRRLIPPQPDESAPGAQAIDQTVEFFDFGVDEAIEPPPADQVSEVPATPPCDLTGSSSDPVEDPSICSSGSLDPPATPDLPAPRVVGRSAMQFRPVLSVLPGSCQGSKEPPPDQPAQLPGSDGCYDLGPSGLTVTKADMKAESDVSGMLYVAFTLDEADAAASIGWRRPTSASRWPS